MTLSKVQEHRQRAFEFPSTEGKGLIARRKDIPAPHMTVGEVQGSRASSIREGARNEACRDQGSQRTIEWSKESQSLVRMNAQSIVRRKL